MLPFGIIEKLDVVEYVCTSLLAVRVGLSSDTLALQELEKTLGNGNVAAVPSAAHTGFQIVCPEKTLSLIAGELRPLTGAQ